MEAFCKACDSIQEVERTEENSNQVYCLACGDEFAFEEGNTQSAIGSSDNKYANYKVGVIMYVEPIAKSKDLKLCRVDVIGDGNEENWIPVVTNAKYAEKEWKVVVACVGAIVPAGATLPEGVDEDDGAIRIKKRAVQGAESRGMLCDCPALGWAGGAKGIIARVPDSFNIGDAPPEVRPRL